MGKTAETDMTEAWLAEVSSGRDRDVLGIFSTPEKAVAACQDKENEYFGAERTPPLTWQPHVNGGYLYAAGYTPPSQFFQVTRFTVDEVLDNRWHEHCHEEE